MYNNQALIFESLDFIGFQDFGNLRLRKPVGSTILDAISQNNTDYTRTCSRFIFEPSLMLLFFLILVGLLTTSSVMANEVDHDAALKKAQTFMPGRQFTESTPVSSACAKREQSHSERNEPALHAGAIPEPCGQPSESRSRNRTEYGYYCRISGRNRIRFQ